MQLRVHATLLLLLLALPLVAQPQTGSLRVTVTDPSGAAVPNVTVLAAPAAPASGPTKAAVVKKDGTYEIKALQPGW